MLSQKEIHEMPLQEKLRLMEAIWEDISSAGDQFESPSWHINELAATEERRNRGEETPVDWEVAKAKLKAPRQDR